MLVRVFARARGELDYRYQSVRAASELRRRIEAIQEEQRVRALTASAQVHERAERAMVDGKLQLELEQLRARSEQVVMRAQAAGAARTLARYQAAFRSLKDARHLTAAEKARLIAEMRALLAEPTPARSTSVEPDSMSAQPPVVLEYRTPGGQAIPVTAEGFRRLIERNDLRAGDECRRIGSLAWTTVAEVLAEESRKA